jgi:hypothetical protein
MEAVDMFDVAEAAYHYLQAHVTGQGSRAYALLSRLLVDYSPGVAAQRRPSECARDIMATWSSVDDCERDLSAAGVL